MKIWYNVIKVVIEMNKRGFTLVELIAMMVVLGILMAITIPNITGILKNNRENIAVEDINKMVSSAKTKFEIGEAKYPKLNECVVMSLKYLDNNNDYQTGVNGGTYNKMESAIVAKKVRLPEGSNVYKYYVRLVEELNGTVYMINFVDYDEFTDKPEDYVPTLVDFTDNMKLGLEENEKDDVNLIINSMEPGLCVSVSNVYTQ